MAHTQHITVRVPSELKQWLQSCYPARGEQSALIRELLEQRKAEETKGRISFSISRFETDLYASEPEAETKKVENAELAYSHSVDSK